MIRGAQSNWTLTVINGRFAAARRCNAPLNERKHAHQFYAAATTIVLRVIVVLSGGRFDSHSRCDSSLGDLQWLRPGIINCNTLGPLGSLRGQGWFSASTGSHPLRRCALRKKTTATKSTEEAVDDAGLANVPLHQVKFADKIRLVKRLQEQFNKMKNANEGTSCSVALVLHFCFIPQKKGTSQRIITSLLMNEPQKRCEMRQTLQFTLLFPLWSK